MKKQLRIIYTLINNFNYQFLENQFKLCCLNLISIIHNTIIVEVLYLTSL